MEPQMPIKKMYSYFWFFKAPFSEQFFKEPCEEHILSWIAELCVFLKLIYSRICFMLIHFFQFIIVKLLWNNLYFKLHFILIVHFRYSNYK